MSPAETPAPTGACKIPLTQGKFALVDAADFDRISAFKWCANRNTLGKFTAVRLVRVGPKKWRTIYMHREIIGAPPGHGVDHISRDSLDNRRANLRLCTHSTNGFNRSKTKNNTSGYKGVFRSSSLSRPWLAKICVKGRQIYLGTYVSRVDAARAYDAGAIRYHGEFAATNFRMEEAK